jgi:hypothetical protein
MRLVDKDDLKKFIGKQIIPAGRVNPWYGGPPINTAISYLLSCFGGFPL